MIIIGDSALSNSGVIRKVKDACVAKGWVDVIVKADSVSPNIGSDDVDPEAYDLAVVDDKDIGKACSRDVLGHGMPTLNLGDVREANGRFNTVLTTAVDRGRMREKIIGTMAHIAETSRMLSGIAV